MSDRLTENIKYTTSIEGISTGSLEGFFVGWPNPPSPETHLKLLQNSMCFVLAIDQETEQVIGFVTAVGDKALAAYIPFLEVLPEYQGKGIGTALMERMLNQLKGCYMIDLLCDAELQKFYEQFGMKKATGMALRNYSAQGGK